MTPRTPAPTQSLSRSWWQALRSRAVSACLVLATCVLAVIGAAASPAQAQPPYVRIAGTGSSWSQTIFSQWTRDVAANGLEVVYTGGGSSKGRADFKNNVTTFAISEIPFQGKDPVTKEEDRSDRPYAYLPIVAGGTAVTYHVEISGKLMREVRLSGETVTKIFTNKITNWNDPQIAADNNGRQFPNLAITPIVRSDGSGTIAQFTAWMDKAYPALWHDFYGRSGLTSQYPVKGRTLAQPGSDGVMNYITSSAGNGTVGVVEYAYAQTADYPVVKIRNAAGYYLEPTKFNVAVALTKARINTDKSSNLYLTQVLDDVYTDTDPRTYPLSSYSYMIIPTAATGTAFGTSGQTEKVTSSARQTLADLMFYSLCEGQSKAGPYGYSPLPLNLVQAGFEQLAKLKAVDDSVDLADRDVTKCNNPTFVPGDLSKNHLAEVAPQPQACDKDGAGPCLTAAAGGPAAPAGPAAAPGGPAPAAGEPGAGGAAGGGAAGGDAAAGGGADGAASGGQIDPETGEVIGASAGGGAASGAVSTQLPARSVAGTPVFAGLAALELAAIILVPGLFALRARRAANAGGGS
ncbi:substrate-binding domain-containing protein [Cellulomonas sp. URHD0024]|uniref:substrate-binding domain-containing protein n=1 Tax=Cellulomonas sp. URHD0024 TaxID=1302620 RepID=UPI000406AC75|nr:substrate-binding domain-containing protein [Cellulomonas sp. URHD0024]